MDLILLFVVAKTMIYPDMVMVFRVPEISSDFCFAGPIPHTFEMVDWFDDAPPSILAPDFPAVGSDEWRNKLAEEVQAKGYFDDSRDYLILHREHPFVIPAVGKGMAASAGP